MASLLTVGTNTYITETDASAYFATMLNVSAWDSADTATREKSLAMACKAIEQKMFTGYPTNDTQSLKWPREAVYDNNNNEYDNTSYPKPLKDAQCEEALMILKMNADKGAKSMDTRLAQGSNNVKIGDIAIVYSEPVRYGGLLSEKAWLYLQPLLLRTVNTGISASANMQQARHFFERNN